MQPLQKEKGKSVWGGIPISCIQRHQSLKNPFLTQEESLLNLNLTFYMSRVRQGHGSRLRKLNKLLSL
jgi:hypothetical protein